MAKKEPKATDVYAGAQVRMHRLKKGMSQTKLGDALNLTFQQVQKYEKGMNRIGASRLQEIANILDVPVSTFFPKSGNSSRGVPPLDAAFATLSGTRVGQTIIIDLAAMD